MSLVVTGTDTDVGKTIASAILLVRFASVRPLAYWKPIATGARDSRDTRTVRRLLDAGGEVLPEEYLFEAPLSPHAAARLEGRTVDPERILEKLVGYGLERPDRGLLIEGIGGLYVPLNDEGYLFSDLLAEMHLPCIVVARSGLGTINHTLLTLAALRERHIAVAGVVLNGPRDDENRQAIERFGRTQVIATIEPLLELTPRAIASAAETFDEQGLLLEFFA